MLVQIQTNQLVNVVWMLAIASALGLVYAGLTWLIFGNISADLHVKQGLAGGVFIFTTALIFRIIRKGCDMSD